MGVVRQVVPGFLEGDAFYDERLPGRGFSAQEVEQVRESLLPLVDRRPWDGASMYAAGMLYTMGDRSLDVEPMIEALRAYPDVESPIVLGDFVTMISGCARPDNYGTVNEFLKASTPGIEEQQFEIFRLCYSKPSFRQLAMIDWVMDDPRYSHFAPLRRRK